MLVGMLPNITHWTGWIFIAAFFGSSMLTVMYTFRMIKAVFLGPATKLKLQPVASVMLVPSLICAGLCLWFFYASSPFASAAWFQPMPLMFVKASNIVTLASAGWVVLSIVLAIIVYRKPLRIVDQSQSPIDVAFDKALVAPTLGAGRLLLLADNLIVDRTIHRLVYVQVALAKIGGQLDRYVIDGAVKLVARIVGALGLLARSLVAGKIQSYLFWALTGFVVLILWFLK
jgi:hypothetical protein